MSQLKKRVFIISTLILLSGLSACANQSGTTTRAPVLRIDYAEITEIRRVTMPTAMPAGAILGGFTGLVLSSGRSGSSRAASGIGGAALGAIAASALEGDRRGYNYNLRFVNGGEANFTTEKSYLRVGDCVSVERGQYSNIRHVPNSMCQTGSEQTVANPEHTRMAAQCVEAKNQLLASSSAEAIELARQKVVILCQNFDD